jgi:uncharacterized protein (TIGR02118 family)
MIKLVCFFRRKPGMSIEDFHRHWLESHGPLIAGTPELAQHLVRYEQNHRLGSDYGRDPEDAPGFDGATVQWLESMESFYAFVREPKYRELIAPDEARFLDRESITLLFTEDDDVKIDGNARLGDASVKLLCLLKRKADMTPADFHAYWSGAHAKLFIETAELVRHVIAYHQSHRVADDYAHDAGGGFDGLAEQWYESLDAFRAMVREPAYEPVPVDEERFIDRPALTFILSAPPDVIVG